MLFTNVMTFHTIVSQLTYLFLQMLYFCSVVFLPEMETVASNIQNEIKTSYST